MELVPTKSYITIVNFIFFTPRSSYSTVICHSYDKFSGLKITVKIDNYCIISNKIGTDYGEVIVIPYYTAFVTCVGI